MNNIDFVADYINYVRYNQIPIGNKIKQAIRRHEKDLERSLDPDYPYYYDPKEALEPVAFIEMLPDPKTRKTNKLAKFQKFIIAMIYGWRKKKNKMRRFRKVYISLARKNGKSILVAGISLYEFLLGQYPNASRQIVAAANTKDQASIVFNMLKSQLKALRAVSDGTRKVTKVNKKDIEHLEDESTVKPLSSDADSLDGLDVLCGVLDEYGEAKSTAMIEVLESSQSQQLQGLILIISTTTKNLNGPMHSIEYPFITKLLNEEVEADAYLALCWEMDSLSEVDDEANWIKSNPLFENAQLHETMYEHKVNSLAEYKAKGDMSGWLTKEMNFWVQSSQDSFIDKESWEAVKQTKPYDIKGRPVYIGLDLARTGDMTAVSWVIPIAEERKLLLDSHAFIASVGGIEAKQIKDKIPYRQYEKLGLVNISQRPDGLIDHEDMCEWIREFITEYDLDLQGIYYDGHQATPSVINLSKDFPDKLIEVPQRIQYLNAPTKYLRDAIIKGEVIQTDNPLLNRAVYNAIMREFADNIAIEKAMNRNKIDPIDALINAMSEAMYFDYEYISFKELIEEGKFGFGV
ncbi:terminase large subunit [Enterococcus phage vB_EfaS_Ef5.4]|nr:terminase large subunit [Enterococcus phage vB_EfaS_Ef5.4]